MPVGEALFSYASGAGDSGVGASEVGASETGTSVGCGLDRQSCGRRDLRNHRQGHQSGGNGDPLTPLSVGLSSHVEFSPLGD